MNLSSGEPPPPGFEDEVQRAAEIEKVIQNYKGNALIGLEYTIELQEEKGRGEPEYQCVLCDRRGDPRTIMQHWTSFQHRLKYLEKHYPTAIKELDPIRNKADKMKSVVQTLAEAVERHHGRLPLCVAGMNEFRRMKTKLYDDVNKKFHYDERNGPNFVNAIDRSKLQIPSLQKKDGEGLDEISSDSDGTQNTPRKGKKREQSPAYRVVPTKKSTPPPPEASKVADKPNVKFPTPKELSLQASHIAQEKYKWEKYRCLLEIYLKQMETQQKEYEKNPEKHPLYPEEWKAFWNRRYKELQKEKKVDPNNYDYRPEWAQFWAKRKQELYNQEIEKKKKEIKLKLELPEDAEEKVDKLKEKYMLQPSARNPSRPSDKSPPPKSRARNEPKVIDISDEDSPPKRSPRRRSSFSRSRSRRSRTRSPPYYERKRQRVRTKSRSISPFSDDYEYESRHQYERGLMQQRKSRGLPTSSLTSSSSSRRYPLPPSPGEFDYYEMSKSKHSHYGHVRNGKESFSSHLQYDRISQSPPPPPKQQKPKPEPEPEPEIEGPLTVVAVLRLLTALEDNLGSLGPKMVDLLGKALALENVKANSADELLMNDDNCVFFETAKEKLKGLLIAEVIEDAQKVRAVKKAIRHIAAIVHQVQSKGKMAKEEPTTSLSAGGITETKQNKTVATIKDLPFDRQLVASKLAAALVMQGREDLSTADMDKLIYFFILMVKLSKAKMELDGSPLQFTDIAKEIGVPIVAPRPKISMSLTSTASTSKPIVPIASLVDDIFEAETAEAEISNDIPDKNAKNEGNSSLESLTDSDLQTLLQNFKHLSTEEQHHLIAHLKKLETADPVRVEKLRKFVNLNDLAEAAGTSNNASSSSAQRSQRNDASVSSTASKRTPLNRHYEDDVSRHSLSRDRGRNSDDEDVDLRTRSDKIVVNPNKFSLDDEEEDDDYNFEDVFKAASSNVEKRTDSNKINATENSSKMSAVIEPPAPGTSKSAGDALTFNRSAMNSLNLNEAQSLIANIMGNLNQNNATKKPLSSEPQNPHPQPVPSLMPNVSNMNMPFYQQQQQQQQPQNQQFQQQYPPPQQQQQANYQQQQQYGAYQWGQMGNNQAAYYNAGAMNPAYNNGGYPGPFPGQGQPPPQWGGQQQQQQHQMGGYNMYGGN